MKKEFKQIDFIQEEDVDNINNTNKLLKKVFYRSVIIYSFITIVFLILTICFYKHASILSIIPKEVYLFILLFSILFLTISTINFFLSSKSDLESLKKSKGYYSTFDTIGFIINTIIVIGFCLLFIMSTAKVDGDSMNNTYKDNDTILVWTFNYNPKIDDVVIIDSSSLIKDTNFIIKRIVATSNDLVEYKFGGMFVNDILIEEMSEDVYNDTLYDSSNAKYYDYVPKDYFIVLGDNRKNSVDSRLIGLIHKDEIIGKSIFRLTPFSSFGLPDKDINKSLY